MLTLPDVTLVLIETREHTLARLALDECLMRVEFGDVLIFTDKPREFASLNKRMIAVPDWPDKVGWSRCFWYEVPRHIRTSHALGIQWDSWVVAPQMWRDELLEYDYCGAPWWHTDGMNVGNGGFSLRSTKLMRFVRRHRDRFPCITAADDDLYCRTYRPTLEQEGFVWAPEQLAYSFAFECVRPDPAAQHFGFHAAFNFDYGCGGDEERMLERAQLMVQSNYIRNGSNIWKGFAQKHPKIVSRLQQKENGDG